jgi:putative DNA primase/helicase
MSVDRFADWKARADERDLHEVAVQYGAKLKRVGREWVGPCPACAGRDRFGVSQTRHKWNCRGAAGGHGAISMVMHIAGLSFLQACEALTGEPNPSGRQAKPLSDAEKAAINRRRLENEAAQRAREAQQMQQEENSREAAKRIWDASKPIAATIAESYLVQRGFIGVTEPVFRFHPALPYPGKEKRYPALICRVDDMMGELTAVWRVYLREDGRKADLPNCKMGLGPASGGAVRIGGMAGKINIAEGVESALGYWCLIGRSQPCWAGLSTSGLIGFEAPLGVEQVIIAPDGDAPIKKQGTEFVPAMPAGRKAAEALRGRLLEEGVKCAIAAYPPPGKDFNDLWIEMQREVA